MDTFHLRADDVEIAGTVHRAWTDASPMAAAHEATWHIVVELPAGDPRLVRSDGVVNYRNLIGCRVTPVAPYRDWLIARGLLEGVLGQRVRLRGSWGDLTPGGVLGGLAVTEIRSVAWIVVDRGLASFVEENGFTQTVRDIDLFAFTDDRQPPPGEMPPPHHREDRHLEIAVPFPFRPQSTAVPMVAECVDCDDREHLIYYGRTVSRPRFPLGPVRQQSRTVVSDDAGDRVVFTIDTGSPAAGQGFWYAKYVLAYDEGFDKMCSPDSCLDDPNWSCQATGEERFSYVWPSIMSARPGSLLLGPAGPRGVLGQLLGALQPAQLYDHMVMFVEDDRQTIRHCTAADARIQEETYYNGRIGVSTPIGSVSKPVPLNGIRADVVQYAWPGSITQTLGEVTVSGRNQSNPEFSYATLFPAVIAAEAAAPPRLWQLDPAERDKRTAFHDPEAAGRAKRERDVEARKWYPQVRLQRTPAWREEINPATGRPIGQLSPVFVQPHPLLAAHAYPALAVMAEEAKRIRAHYRFFAYSDGAIALNPAFGAPPAGAWGPEEGRDWAAGTVAAVCSSFVLAAAHAANAVLAARGRPVIELEGGSEPTDGRAAAAPDGLYEYHPAERLDAGRALFGHTYRRVTEQVHKEVDEGYVSALDDVLGFGGQSPVEKIADHLATVVANQLCNAFAFDAVTDLGDRWTDPSGGRAVSPDDIMLRWDPNVAPEVFPPTKPGVVNVYGQATPIAVPRPGWRREPIYRVLPVDGVSAVNGMVVRRGRPGEEPEGVAGAVVRLGCQATESLAEGDFHLPSTKSGRYHIQAFRFVRDPISNVGREWSSERRTLDLAAGETVDDVVLELVAPPGLARDVLVESHHDIVDRVVVGKDRWAHPDLDGIIELAYDPDDLPEAPPDQRNTRLRGEFDRITEEVGSGVHVRVTVRAALKEIPGPNGSIDYDGTVVCDLTLDFYDDSEGEVNDTLTQTGIELALGASHTMPYNLVSDDQVPERASGHVTIRSAFAVL